MGIGQSALALSPDGANLVYVADLGGKTQLYQRPMDQFEAAPIPGTEGAYNPFFSPDGQWIGFFAGNEMKKVSIGGGEPVLLCEVTNPHGASWGPDDRIIFSHHEGNTLSWISASGGTPQHLTDKQSSYTYRWPEILQGDYLNIAGRSYDVSPDGRRFLLLKSSEEPSRQTQLNVVTNWFEEVKRKVPRGK